jgi:hypothetical protein
MLAKYVGVRTCGTTVTRVMVMILQAGYIREMLGNIQFRIFNPVKVKQSLYSPWRRLGGEEV